MKIYNINPMLIDALRTGNTSSLTGQDEFSLEQFVWYEFEDQQPTSITEIGEPFVGTCEITHKKTAVKKIEIKFV